MLAGRLLLCAATMCAALGATIETRTPAPRRVVHEIRMIGDEGGYRVEPYTITIVRGDTVRFRMVSGGPHNVVFDTTGWSDAARLAMRGAMESTGRDLIGPFSSPIMFEQNDSLNFAFTSVPAGTYAYRCAPHTAMGEAGSIIVKER